MILSVWAYFGDWEKPYLTMAKDTEANIVRSLGKIIENGHLQKGVKPVHWCIDCGSALAEAEVEYEDKQSPAIDVRFAVVDNASLPAAVKCDSRSGLHLYCYLDHHTLDFARQPGCRSASRVELRADKKWREKKR